MKTVIQIVLGVACAILAYLLYDSLMKPIRFEKAVEHRKSLVVERLKDIRTLEVAYKEENGQFAGSFDTLINFYKNGNISIIKQIGSMDDSVAVAKGIVRRDTIHIPVKDTLLKHKGFNIDSIGIVPVVGTPFKLQAVMYESLSKVQIPLFQASVTNDEYLKGLDRQSIVNLNDELEKANKFEGVKVGDIHTPNNNAGNWE